MSDRRTRELERAAASGDPEARAAWLGARLRAGDLEEERLALAAWLGDPGARLALGCEPEAERASPAALVRGLARWGREPGRGDDSAALARPDWRDQLFPRAALALARVACAGRGLPGPAQAALTAAEAWIEHPRLGTAATAGAAAAALVPPHAPPPAPEAALCALAAYHCSAARGSVITIVRLLRAAAQLPLSQAKHAVSEVGEPAAHMASVAVARAGEEAVLDALRAALIPWLLGLSRV